MCEVSKFHFKRFPTEQSWKTMWQHHHEGWRQNPNFSENWVGTTGPRKLYYNTGRDKGGYRSGLEGRYRVADIEQCLVDGIYRFVVVFNTKLYGKQNDTYSIYTTQARNGAGFTADDWPITGEQAVRLLNWQKQIGIFEAT